MEDPTAQPPIDPTANPADAPKLDELGNPVVEEAKESVISEEIMVDMKNIFQVFDSENKDQVTVDELRTIMRALDVPVPDEESLEEIKTMIDPDGTGFITFARLIVVMEEKLKETDTVEDLMEQLKKLDRDADGKIPSPEFK